MLEAEIIREGKTMGELSGTTEYLFWSGRRTGRFLEDNGLTPKNVTSMITTPAFPWLPIFSRSSSRTLGTRPAVAKSIERFLGKTAVTSFDTPGPILYAKGTSTVR
jgi:hypothetical protein